MTTPVSAASPAAAHSIDTAMRRTLLDSMVSSPYGVDAIWLIVMVSIWNSVPPPRALVLAIAYGTMAAIRYGFHFLYVRRKPADDRLEAWLRVYVVISIGIGLGWTAQTLVLLGTVPSFVWVLPLVALGVMTVNAAYARALHLPTALGFFVPALLPQAIGLAFQDDAIARGLGVGSLAYLVALALWTRGVHRRLRERYTVEAELRAALAHNADLQDELKRGRRTLNTVLDNLDDGVELYDSADRRIFGNAAIRRLHDIPEGVYARTATARDMIAWRFDRGEFGPAADRDAEIDRRAAVLHDPAAVIQRPTVTGRTVELRFKQLPDGGVLSMHRDITRLKEREAELAAAKEEAEASRLAAETAQNVMRTVLDAMDDGVILIDRAGRCRYTNRAIRDVYQVDEETLAKLPTIRDIFLYQARRGDYGPLKDPEASVDRLIERFWRGEADRMGRTVTGRWLDYRYHPLPDGSIVMTHRDITDLKRHEDELAAAKEEAERARAETAQALERLQVVIENMSDGVMLFDRELRWAIDNQKVRDLLDLPKEVAHLGAASADIQRFQVERGDFGDIEDVEADVRGWLERRRSIGHFTYGRWTRSGRFVEYTSRPLPNGEIVATYRDITELKRTQAEAEQARNRLEDAIRALPSGFSLHDDEARLIVFNDPYERFFGNTPGLLKIGGRYEDLLREMQRRGRVRPEHRDRGEAWIAEMAAHHRSSFGDREMATADERWIRISKHPTRDGGVVTLVTDLTEAKARERELARARADAEGALSTARTIIETMPIGAALISADNRIRLSNRRLTELLELPDELGAEGRPYVDAMRHIWRRGDFPGDAPFDDRVREFFTRIRDERDLRYERRMPSGRHVEFRFTALADGGVLGSYVDITESRRQQEALARARADAEDALSTARTIIETMPVGSALVGADRRIRLSNARFTELLDLPAEFGSEGRSYVDSMRALWERGDFPGSDFEERTATFFRLMQQAGGLHYQRQMPSGRHIDFNSTVLADGSFLCTYVDTTEAKRHEEALARARDEATEARRRLVSAMESMADGIAFLDTDERLLLCNEAYRGFMRGMPEIVTPGTKLADAVAHAGLVGAAPPGRAAEWTVATMAALRAGELTLIPYGPQQWARVLMRRGEDGRAVILITDVSQERRRQRDLERALAAAEAAGREATAARALLQDAIDSTPDGFALWDEEDRLIVCNDGYRRYYGGVPLKVEPGLRFAEILAAGFDAGLFVDAPEDRDAFLAATLRMRANPRTAPREHRLRGDLSLQVIDRRTASGGLVSVYADISEQKRRQRELEQARDAAEAAGRDAANARTRLVDAIEALPNGFVLFDAEDRLVLTNQRFLEYYAEIADITVPGVHVREMLTQGAIRGAVSTGSKSVEDWVETRMAMRGNPGAPMETRQPNGRWIVIGERRTREGGLAGIYTDISELKRREAELEQARDEAETANQAKSTFLATMSHEIRTPMNGVLGMMEILERQGIDDEQQSTVETMRESAQALLRIIDDVLDFSKIEAGRLELESTAFSLSGVIEGAMAAVRPQAIDKSLPLSTDIDPGSSDALEGDPVRVRQILLNLVGNAVKFTERGFVRIAASTAPLGDGRIRVLLSVADSGIGMDEALLARLFEPFAQADSSTTRRYGGTGLGLSIVRRLAQLMGGDVSVDSKPGAGTTFRVTLVLRAAPDDSPLRAIAPLAVRARRTQPAALAGRVLVVDDHPVNRKVLVKQLGLLGIAADTAADGIEALSMWRMAAYAAVLADIHMPRMDGYELAGTIRREEGAAATEARHTPLIAVTANAMRGEEERCLAAGMDAYLAKPVTFERLRAALSRWLPIGQDDDEMADATETPAINELTLRAWLGDDPDAVAELLQDFLRDARQAERDIGASLSAGNLPALAATAHRLKGSALAIGARRLAEIVTALEQAGRTGDRAGCQDGLGSLAGELRRVAGEIGR
ncbi:MAG: PAS-domain containing protein [Alphaproteobacteria bacterium]|nr:PAS-domain containing protein [Alphaproteobacteria bacterium]MCW5741859.1 PAS-domain containing protein [Alphaproteobacteria bacterium]